MKEISACLLTLARKNEKKSITENNTRELSDRKKSVFESYYSKLNNQNDALERAISLYPGVQKGLD